jgi:rubrerythrin
MGFVSKTRSTEAVEEQELLKASWEGEYLGVGFFQKLLEKFPEYTDELQANASMEWFNIGYCKQIAHDLGVHMTLEHAEKMQREGVAFAEKADTFEDAAKAVMEETPGTVKMYSKMAESASSAQLKTLGTDFCEHEQAMCDWFQSVVEGKSDGAEKVFAYLERHGVTREGALAPLEV